jgi:uncharacterized protein YxeA
VKDMGSKCTVASVVALTVILILACNVMYAGTILDRIQYSKNKKYAVLILKKYHEVSKTDQDTFKLNGIDLSLSKYNRILFFAMGEDSVYYLS